MRGWSRSSAPSILVLGVAALVIVAGCVGSEVSPAPTIGPVPAETPTGSGVVGPLPSGVASPGSSAVPPESSGQPGPSATPERTLSPQPYPGMPTPTPAPPAAGPGIVSGVAVAGPVCPVERVPPDPSCAPRPVAGAALVVDDSSGREVLRVTTAADGSFSFRLTPGNYRLVPQPVQGLMGVAPPVDFSVASGAATPPLTVSYDTGIR